jgi:uncharacterized membrane protein YeaQ/YmgE (transglycosylase-associated protein family)
MGVISWIVLGLIVGFIASKIVNKTGSGLVLDVVIGVVGALVGGYISSKLGLGGMTNIWDPWSWLIAIIGAIIVLLAYRAVASRT